MAGRFDFCIAMNGRKSVEIGCLVFGLITTIAHEECHRPDGAFSCE
jgi:hypothetical protein